MIPVGFEFECCCLLGLKTWVWYFCSDTRLEFETNGLGGFLDYNFSLHNILKERFLSEIGGGVAENLTNEFDFNGKKIDILV